MRTFLFNLVTLRAFIVFTVLASVLHGGEVADPREPKREFIQSFLRELSRLTGDVFVLELWCKDDEAPETFIAPADIAILNKYTSAEKVIPAYFPKLNVTRGSQYGNLYYISDYRLRDLKAYSLNQDIPPTQFRGDGTQAISKLSELVPTLKPITWYSTHDINCFDKGFAPPKVSFGEEAKTVRQALSSVSTSAHTHGIFWVATTRIRGDTHETTVGYTTDVSPKKD